MENAIEKNPLNFKRKNLCVFIGSMLGKPTAWIGTENDMAPIVEYKMDFENRNLAIEYILETLKKLSLDNSNGDNLNESDIETIGEFLKKGENKLKTKEILKD